MTKTTEQSIEQFLKQWVGKPIYQAPLADETGRLVGNNGDMLILAGAQVIFDQLGLTFVDKPEDAELIMIGGNGGMLEKYRVVPGVFHHCWKTYADKPLVMLPATFNYPTQGVCEGLPDREQPVTLFAREKISYKHLTEDHDLPLCCTVGLDKDTAFYLPQSDRLDPYLNRDGTHVLIVERDDVEHPIVSFENKANSTYHRISRMIPKSLKKPLYPLKTWLRGKRTTVFRKACEKLLAEHHADLRSMPKMVKDVSHKKVGDFDHFRNAIADASVVFSQRLHVGIYAALLGKPTYIFEGPYHKIRAIYEHSMTQFEHVRYISREDMLELGS